MNRPLCDKDRFTMTFGGLVMAPAGAVEIRHAYLCNHPSCLRCYDEAAGYFDFIDGLAVVGERQKLCESDAHPMYLEAVRDDGEQTWRCPNCGIRRQI